MAENGEAGPSRLPLPQLLPYQTTSQYKHWRYSLAQLQTVREELNSRTKEVTRRNVQLEQEAQISLGHEAKTLPTSEYLSVEDELLLLRFYCGQCSVICRKGFGLPEVVESTAISYLKRFYLKNSLMEWHPKNIMPTCLFLAAKTTNHPVPLDIFTPRMKGLSATDILETEFLVAQSLGFGFWVRGAEKALRGWGLELQRIPGTEGGKRTDAAGQDEKVRLALPAALEACTKSRMTDAEFIYTPGQIGLACWYAADRVLVQEWLEERYTTAGVNDEGEADENGAADAEAPSLTFGLEKDRLLAIIQEIAVLIEAVAEEPKEKVKEVDKRLRGCTNPEKVPGSALYKKRQQEKEAALAESKASKVKLRAADDEVFGGTLGPTKRPLSPRVSLGRDREYPGEQGRNGDGARGAEVKMDLSVQAEGNGMLLVNDDLARVGEELDDDEDT